MTVNTVNLKRYYGIHRQKKGFGPKDFDGYLGSGDLLIKAFKKYGKENFKRVTLAVFPSLEEALLKEKEVVCAGLVQSDTTYNMTLGGGIPPSAKGKKQTEAHKIKRGVYSQKGKKKIYTADGYKKVVEAGKRSLGSIKPKCSCIYCRKVFGCNVVGNNSVHTLMCGQNI